MAVNKILLTFLALNAIFVALGGLLLAGVFVVLANNNTPTVSNVSANLLLMQTPLRAATFNAGLIFITFLASIPGATLSTNRSFLKLHSWLVIACAVFTLVLGLDVWFSTLKTRANLGVLWSKQTPHMQVLLQQRFNCCGYLSATSPPFQQDNTCPSIATATLKGGCVGPFSNFANGFLDLIFTAIFGFVGIDVLLFLSGVVVLKDRAEKERYRHIDEKNGFGSI